MHHQKSDATYVKETLSRVIIRIYSNKKWSNLHQFGEKNAPLIIMERKDL